MVDGNFAQRQEVYTIQVEVKRGRRMVEVGGRKEDGAR